jgi:ribose 5-phosphate isomerase B
MTEMRRIVVGCDDAGTTYRGALEADLRNDLRGESVIDVTDGIDPTTAYPHLAVDAARMIDDGRSDRALLVCGTGPGVARLPLRPLLAFGGEGGGDRHPRPGR